MTPQEKRYLIGLLKRLDVLLEDTKTPLPRIMAVCDALDLALGKQVKPKPKQMSMYETSGSPYAN